MARRKERVELTLKNGARADARHVLAVLGALRAMLELDPKRFGLLLALGQSERSADASADARALEDLKREGFVGPDGKILPDVADILLSSLEMRGDGPVLVNPFRLQSEAERIMADRAQQQNDDVLLKAIFGRRRPRGTSRD